MVWASGTANELVMDSPGGTAKASRLAPASAPASRLDDEQNPARRHAGAGEIDDSPPVLAA